MFLLNSRLARFTAIPTSFSAGLHQSRHRLFRSYAVSLPSSLTTAHSSTLEFSSHLPVSVCGTGSAQSPLRGFSWQHGYVELWPIRAPCSPLGDDWKADLPTFHAYRLKPAKPTAGPTSLLRHPLESDDYTLVQEYST